MKLIDADALKHMIESMNFAQPFMDVTRVLYGVGIEIDNAPSIDLVRCSECRWSRPRTLKGETGYRCVFYRVDKAETGYCDCGERKESE